MKRLKFCYPNLTRTISITGEECALNCAHCGRYYLKFMETPDTVRRRGPRHYRSALVSGGVNGPGWVPVEGFTEFFRLLREWQWRLNFHVGLLPADLMGSLSGVADRVSFDYVVDDMTIREVYGLDACGEDYQKTYRALASKFHVVPHITLGLLGGTMRGEREALESLAEFKPGEIVFLIFKPTRTTCYEGKKPPTLKDVEGTFEFARNLFPAAAFSLGCMRPRGEYGLETEIRALRYGFDTIVLPSVPFRTRISKEKIQSTDSWECCVL